MSKLGEKITVLVATQVNGSVVFKEVSDAYAKGFLAVHRITPELSPNEEGYRITHTITGFQVRKYEQRKQAIAVRDALVEASDLDWEFTDAKTGVNRELRDRVQEIEKKALAELDREATPDKEVNRVAGDITYTETLDEEGKLEGISDVEFHEPPATETAEEEPSTDENLEGDHDEPHASEETEGDFDFRDDEIPDFVIEDVEDMLDDLDTEEEEF